MATSLAAPNCRSRAALPVTPRWLVTVLCVLLPGRQPMPAQPSQTSGQDLTLVALRGDNATHFVNYHRREVPAVQVQIGNIPARGIEVTFQLPESGPGGSFSAPDYQAVPRSTKSLRVRTDKRGRAEARGFEPNKELGEYDLEVTAMHGTQLAKLQLKQRNAWSETVQRDNRKLRKELIISLGIVAGSLVVVALFASRAWK